MSVHSRTSVVIFACALLAACDGESAEPGLGQWRNMNEVSAPEGRVSHTAVWTGSEMIVWGGERAEGGSAEPIVFYDSGGRYDPVADAWTPTSMIDAPSGRTNPTAVWTGTELIVWGGTGFVGDEIATIGTGGRYEPATDTWRAISPVDAPEARTGHRAVWTGAEMIVWGGAASDPGGSPRYLTDGARYDPASDTWASMSSVDAPATQLTETAVWTGTEMIIWRLGIGGPQGVEGVGGRYDPTTDTWTATSKLGAPRAVGHVAVAWQGRMLVWSAMSDLPAEGGVYDPASDSWQPMSKRGAPGERLSTSAASTDAGFIVWGGFNGRDDDDGIEVLQTGGAYDAATDSWETITTEGAPTGRDDASLVWTGAELIVWAGFGDAYLRSGGRWSP
jgi:N-acetylneuraminic acid mutarotase